MLLSYITISNISPLTSEWYRRDNGKDKVRIKKILLVIFIVSLPRFNNNENEEK